MSQHSQRTQDGPSAASIIVGAALTIGAVAVAGWVIAGSALDGRHLAGYGGWMLLALLLAGQTIVRAAEWQVIRERIRDREDAEREAAEQRAQQDAEHRAAVTGTWRGDGPGQELTVRLDDEGNLVVQGWLSDHWQQQEERIWSQDVSGLSEMVLELERSGELGPVNDAGTVFVRTLLDLGAWPLPSFDQLEHELAPEGGQRAFRYGGPIWDGTGMRDWTKRDGDTQVVSQTA